jgi:CRISPR type I-E-associated protein CasB/Cse2
MTKTDSLYETLSHAGQWVAEAGPGTRAELRRLDPGRGEQWQCGSFYRALAAVMPDAPAGERSERLWAVLLGGLARIDHVPRGPRPGELMARHNFSELRLARLLEADATQLPQQLRSAVHYLGSKGVTSMDWSLLASLLFDRSNSDRVRRDLARDYYRAASNTIKEKGNLES